MNETPGCIHLPAGNRRVSIDPALVSTSKTTNKKKTKSRPTDKPSRRIGPKGSDIEEEQGDDEDDALDGSLDANRYSGRL
jgi:hypothetical protein